MTNLFKDHEKICHENRKTLLDIVSSVKFLLSGGKADTPDQDLTIDKLFLTDKDLGKNCAELLVKQARYQFKFFLEKMMEKANVNGTLNFLWNEIGADLIENNGIACISLNEGESVINCESFVNLTDELLKVTGFDELQLIKRNDCREVSDASDIFDSPSRALDKVFGDSSISESLCTLDLAKHDNARNCPVNSSSENSECDDTERNEGGVVDEHSHSSEYDIFRDVSPISEKETTTTQDWKNLDSYLSTHLAKTASSESENTEGNEGMAVGEDSDSSEFVFFREDSPVSENENISTLRSETDISFQGSVNDDTARNSNSDNSGSEDTERNDGRRIDVDSDSSESVIFREGSPVCENENISTLRSETDISFQGSVNDDTARNSNSGNSGSDSTEWNDGERVGVDSSVSENENISTRTSEPDISSPGSVNGDNVRDSHMNAYTRMRKTVLQKHRELLNHYTENSLKLEGKVAIVYKNTKGVIKTVYCDKLHEARQKAYSLIDVQKNPYPVVFIDETIQRKKTPSILAELHARESNFPDMEFSLDTGADEGSIGFDKDKLKNFTFTADAINKSESYEPSVLCKFTTECTEPQDVHVFDVDEDPDWNALGLPLFEKCVVFLDMKNDTCLLRKHEEVIIEETEEGKFLKIEL